MGKTVKKMAEVLGKAVVVLFFFGLLFFPVMLFGMMGAFPLYVTKAIGVVGAILYLIIVMVWSGLISAAVRGCGFVYCWWRLRPVGISELVCIRTAWRPSKMQSGKRCFGSMSRFQKK